VTRATVVKVGGSLLDWPPFPDRLAAYCATRRDDRVVVIVGGGKAADLVRELDRVHGLGDDRAHRLALHALDLTARIVAAIVPNSEIIDQPETLALALAWQRGRVPVLVPRTFLDLITTDPLRASWDVTTDSIAARIAVHLNAIELALLKSTPVPPGTDRAAAARLGLVDPAFPAVSAPIERVTYLNFRDPQAAPETLAR
jgi:aspartokinase-like uncharacterized kinase